MLRLTSMLLLLLLLSCGDAPEGDPDRPQQPEDTTTERTLPPASVDWRNYQNPSFDFALERPRSWQIVESDPAASLRVVNIYNPEDAPRVSPPITIHSDAALSHLSFYPEGWGTDLPTGDRRPLERWPGEGDLSFGWDTERSQAFLLQNGQVWGYLLYPSPAPAGWNEEGYIFAQARVGDFQSTCYDGKTGAEKNARDCAPLQGDRVVRTGQIAATDRAVLHQMLGSLRFTSGGSAEKPIRDLLRVETPLPDEDVRSPLTVKGKARGYWYFEGDFPVELVDAAGNTLAEGVATAQGNWMSEDFVPFEAKLTFDSPGEEQGRLLFHRANPSGMPENDRTYRQPVIFMKK